jgi:hypothetical protein
MGRWLVVGMALAGASAWGQLTPEQKALDLQTIASLYAKQYAPYEWKRDALGFDLFDLRPWLERARQTKTDLEYLDLVAEYTGSLQDIHSYYVVNSDFVADLHVFTDVVDGKVVFEQLDRSYLPASRFDFAVGDEIVQFNGRPVMDVLRDLGKIASFGNPRSTLRWAADQLVYQQQAYIPRAAELGESATLLVRRADGSEKSYTIPWDKSGTPLMKLGPLPNFRMARTLGRDEGAEEVLPADPGVAGFRRPWVALQRHVSARPVRALRGFGGRDPIYRMPTAFVQRLGRNRSDFFFSGTQTVNGKRVGLIRIGTFQPVSFSLLSLASNQFTNEITYMKANTDVLVVDVTRTEGGFACYAEDLEQRLIPKPFQTIGLEMRPNLELIRSFEYSVLDAQDFGEEWEVRAYSALLKDLKTAYSENRGRTGPIPLCGTGLDLQPLRDRNGAAVGYEKPMLLLTDEFSTSAADSFAAVLQDAKVAKVFGFRTAGAGGNTSSTPAGFYSEGTASVTQMLTVRPEAQSIPGFGTTRYVENVGVRPDIEYDYQTRENLLGNGAAFVDAFLKAAVALVPAGN